MSLLYRTAPVFKGDAEVAANVSKFRSWVAAAESMADKYSAAPAPVDFASAKESVRDKALIESLEKLYSTNTPPPEVHEWSAEDRALKDAQIEEARASLAFTQEMIADTERELFYMEANRTTRETSATELAEVYPDIAEEIEDEIDRREWFKDTVA